MNGQQICRRWMKSAQPKETFWNGSGRWLGIWANGKYVTTRTSISYERIFMALGRNREEASMLAAGILEEQQIDKVFASL